MLSTVPIPASQASSAQHPGQNQPALDPTAADISPTLVMAPESVGHQTTPKRLLSEVFLPPPFITGIPKSLFIKHLIPALTFP